MSKRVLHTVVRLFASLALVGLLVWKADLHFEAVPRELAGADKGLVLIALAAFPLLLFLKSVRWGILIAAAGHGYTRRAAFRSYCAAFAVGVLTPGRLGEMAKAFYLRAETDIDLPQAFRTVIGDRIYDLLFLMSFGTVAFFSIFRAMPAVQAAPLLLAIWVIMGLAVFAFLNVSRRVGFERGSAVRAKRYIEALAEDFTGPVLARCWLLTIMAYFVYFGACFLLMRALDIAIPFATASFVIAGMSLILLLPISIAGIGPREATLVYMLGHYGISADKALSFSILQCFSFFVWGGLIGAVAMAMSPVPLKTLRQTPPSLSDKE